MSAGEVPNAAVEAGATAAENMNADAWIAVPDPDTGEPMQQQVPLDRLVEGILVAALPHLSPHPDAEDGGSNG